MTPDAKHEGKSLVSFRLSPGIKKRLEALARAERRTMTAQLEMLIENATTASEH